MAGLACGKQAAQDQEEIEEFPQRQGMRSWIASVLDRGSASLGSTGSGLGAVGVIVGFDAERESSRWVVAFDRVFPGGGYADESGRQCLRLEDGQLEEISDTKGGDMK